MSRILFEPDLPVAPAQPERADIACFVGLARLASSLAPKLAHKVSADGKTTNDVAVTDVKQNDVLSVAPGEIVPVDGLVLDISGGYSLVNEKPFGGSASTVKSLKPGENTVTGGSLNLLSAFTVKATADGSAVAPTPQSARDWLVENGWIDSPNARDCRALIDVPVPIESGPAFSALFDDGSSDAAVGTDYLAAAVRSFFAQGGKKCYVVRMGDPVSAGSTSAQGGDIAGKIVSPDSSAQDRGTWHGIGHLWGLPDVSFLLLPDLPILYASRLQIAKGVEIPITSGPEVFGECVPGERQPADTRHLPSPAPRSSFDDYGKWGGTIREVVEFLSSDPLREVQFVAAVPLPYVMDASAVNEMSSDIQSSTVHDAIHNVFPELTVDTGLSASSAFLQLAYPWLRSTRSQTLLEGIEPPDGTLAGLLARNALVRGTFTSATKITPNDVYDIYPQLPVTDLTVPDSPLRWDNKTEKPLIVRLSLFGFTPGGIGLLSDVTAYPGEAYRSARVNRLVSVICRNARHFGQTHIFENNDATLWRAFELTLGELLTRLWSAGALDGATPAQAFDVRCDRSTMTQNDIDNGRMIAVVSFQAASIVELIRVVLTVETAGASPGEILAQMVGTA